MDLSKTTTTTTTTKITTTTTTTTTTITKFKKIFDLTDNLEKNKRIKEYHSNY